ncbi:MAG: glycine dehydrogenase, partial [Desulfamplus sp.]|nr:glycine dehydrogenase [Desulfamplus sp.]
HDKAVYLKKELESAGFSVPFTTPFFNEFVVDTSDGAGDGSKFKAKREALKKKGIVAGLNIEKYYPELKNHYLFCVTEVFSKSDMDTVVREVK